MIGLIGAEAILSKEGSSLVKKRVSKGYRLSLIDQQLIKRRTRKEAKILQKLGDSGFTPKLISTNETDTIVMQYVPGKVLRDHLTQRNSRTLMKEIGGIVAHIHNQDVIHGDLTTSNMIVVKSHVYVIDFGLGYESLKDEDKAVDLHLFKQALESKHYQMGESCFREFLAAYTRKARNAVGIIKRFEQVEKRGRYKQQE